ncbi:hypothetical protein BO71DRAFT_403274, partial [Aspergillus ellipticus CBS 707.79]
MTEIFDSPPTGVPHHDVHDTSDFQPHNSQGTSRFSTAESPNCRHEANIEVVHPYAIEEPEDEPTDTAEWTGTPVIHFLLRDNFDNVQGDLVDSMEGLCCDSDNSNHGVVFGQKRGRKRKPSGTAADSARIFRQRRSSSGSISDIQYKQPNGSPKRPFRKCWPSRERFKSHAEMWQRDSSDTDTGLSGGFTSRSPSTDTSGATLNGYPGPETMDI